MTLESLQSLIIWDQLPCSPPIDPLEGAIIAVPAAPCVAVWYLSQPQSKTVYRASLCSHLLCHYHDNNLPGAWGPNGAAARPTSNWWNLCFSCFSWGVLVWCRRPVCTGAVIQRPMEVGLHGDLGAGHACGPGVEMLNRRHSNRGFADPN